MKRMLILAVAGVVILGAIAAQAGEGCCAAGKAKAKASSCAETFSSLDLTDAQKAKIKELSADCDKNGCSAERHEKFMKGVKEVLTAQQYTKWQAECEKAKKSGTCPYAKGAATKS